MTRTVNTALRLFLILVVLLSVWVGFNTHSIWRDYVGGPPVKFREDKYVSLGLYPAGFHSASVFTNDDACAVTPPAAIEKLRGSLKEWGIKGTFFVIPYHYGKGRLTAESAIVEKLRELHSDGHEIAQHGFLHYCEKNIGSEFQEGAEMTFLSRDEQKTRLREGCKILSALGFEIIGHRSPCFSGNEGTFQALNDLGYLYGSDLRLPPATVGTLLFPRFRGRIYYPFHPSGLKILEVICQADPTILGEKAREIFRRFHRRGGVFVFLTHLPQVSEEENLQRLEEFVAELKSQNTWLCRLDELCRWWEAREKVELKTSREGDTLIIAYKNPSEFSLENARIFLKEGAASLKRYRLVSDKGKLLSEDNIPPHRILTLDFPQR